MEECGKELIGSAVVRSPIGPLAAQLSSAPVSRQSAPDISGRTRVAPLRLGLLKTAILAVSTAGSTRLACCQAALTSSASPTGTSGRAEARRDRTVPARACPCREASRHPPSSRSCRSQLPATLVSDATHGGRWSFTRDGVRGRLPQLNERQRRRTEDRASTRLRRVGGWFRFPPVSVPISPLVFCSILMYFARVSQCFDFSAFDDTEQNTSKYKG